MASERVAYVNGKWVPEAHAVLSIRDLAVTRGECAFDSARTFNGRIFKLREHLERLWSTLAYLRLPAPLTPDELFAVSEELAASNRDSIEGDFWVTQRISRGVPVEHGGDGRPTVIVECTPIPFAHRSRWFLDGVRLVAPSVRRTPSWAVSPRAKTTNQLNVVLANYEVQAHDPWALAVLLDEHGNLTEAPGANVFIVKGDTLVTPPSTYVLPGITRGTVVDLAMKLGLYAAEASIDLYSAYNADEIFITSTSLCVCPAASINGVEPRSGKVPGPTSRRLQMAFSELVGLDVVAQYTSRFVRDSAGAVV